MIFERTQGSILPTNSNDALDSLNKSIPSLNQYWTRALSFNKTKWYIGAKSKKIDFTKFITFLDVLRVDLQINSEITHQILRSYSENIFNAASELFNDYNRNLFLTQLDNTVEIFISDDKPRPKITIITCSSKINITSHEKRKKDLCYLHGNFTGLTCAKCSQEVNTIHTIIEFDYKNGAFLLKEIRTEGGIIESFLNTVYRLQPISIEEKFKSIAPFLPHILDYCDLSTCINFIRSTKYFQKELMCPQPCPLNLKEIFYYNHNQIGMLLADSTIALYNIFIRKTTAIITPAFFNFSKFMGCLYLPNSNNIVAYTPTTISIASYDGTKYIPNEENFNSISNSAPIKKIIKADQDSFIYYHGGTIVLVEVGANTFSEMYINPDVTVEQVAVVSNHQIDFIVKTKNYYKYLSLHFNLVADPNDGNHYLKNLSEGITLPDFLAKTVAMETLIQTVPEYENVNPARCSLVHDDQQLITIVIIEKKINLMIQNQIAVRKLLKISYNQIAIVEKKSGKSDLLSIWRYDKKNPNQLFCAKSCSSELDSIESITYLKLDHGPLLLIFIGTYQTQKIIKFANVECDFLPDNRVLVLA